MITPSPLRIAVLGAGRIGSTFAFQLARVGHHEVAVVARPGSTRFQQLRRDGGIVNIKGERRGGAGRRHVWTSKTPYDLHHRHAACPSDRCGAASFAAQPSQMRPVHVQLLRAGAAA